MQSNGLNKQNIGETKLYNVLLHHLKDHWLCLTGGFFLAGCWTDGSACRLADDFGGGIMAGLPGGFFLSLGGCLADALLAGLPGGFSGLLGGCLAADLLAGLAGGLSDSLADCLVCSMARRFAGGLSSSLACRLTVGLLACLAVAWSADGLAGGLAIMKANCTL